MNRRRTGAAALAALAALTLSACNRESAAPGAAEGTGGEDGCSGVTVGLAVANLQADFFNQIKQSVEAEAKKLGATVRVSDAGGDSATQVNQIQDFITRQVDAIIYIPAGATAAGVPVRAAKQADIPVVAVDRNAPDEPGDTFIATDSVAAAQALGEYVVEQTGGKGKLAILQGQIGTTPQVDRQKGFETALKKAPGIEVVAQQPADWAQDKAFSVGQDMLQANRDINIMWGQADAMALGAAQAVSNANLPQEVLIVGFDGDFAGLEAVRDGTINATMVQQTQEMGRLAVQSACGLSAGEELPAEQLQEAFLLTKDEPEKAQEYIDEHP
jgi:ribose transport system substrate-binding protein